MRGALKIALTSARLALRGGRAYWAWIGFLVTLIFWGCLAYAEQLRYGLAVTSMRDQVSWGLYIGNFTFLVGVAASAIVLVIPAFFYDWAPIKEVAILGEILAISAILMVLLFVTVDMGRPERFWHLIPGPGKINFPGALLAWDVISLNSYLLLNVIIVAYVLGCGLRGKPYNPRIVHPLMIASVPWAIAIQTVEAFIYAGDAGRPYWSTAILAPRFICSSFCSGPAILLILFQVLQRTTRIRIKEVVLWKIAELMAYAMFFNLLMLGAEAFKDFYTGTQDSIYLRYLFLGVQGHNALVPSAWAFLIAGLVALPLLVHARRSHNVLALNVGCILVYASVYIEKGLGTIVPAFTPDTLGEIYEYVPTLHEFRIGAGIFGVGFLVFTLLCKVAIPIMTGEFDAAHEGTSVSPLATPSGWATAPSAP